MAGRPIPKAGFEGLFRLMAEQSAFAVLTPYGGKMARVPKSQIPFPHRGGVNYEIRYGVFWKDHAETEEKLNHMRRIYEYMEGFVSRGPRSAYLCTRDIDLGRNGRGGVPLYSHVTVNRERWI